MLPVTFKLHMLPDSGTSKSSFTVWHTLIVSGRHSQDTTLAMKMGGDKTACPNVVHRL